jgi:hypothetical protein
MPGTPPSIITPRVEGRRILVSTLPPQWSWGNGHWGEAAFGIMLEEGEKKKSGGFRCADGDDGTPMSNARERPPACSRCQGCIVGLGCFCLAPTKEVASLSFSPCCWLSCCTYISYGRRSSPPTYSSDRLLVLSRVSLLLRRPHSPWNGTAIEIALP